MSSYVPADPALIAEGRRRALLTRVAASRGLIRVTNPDHPDGGWVGRIHGLMDCPSIILEDGSGRRWTVPQHFAIEEISEDRDCPSCGCSRSHRGMIHWDGEMQPCTHPWHDGGQVDRPVLAAGCTDGAFETALSQALMHAKRALFRLSRDAEMARPHMTETESRCEYAREALAAIERIEKTATRDLMRAGYRRPETAGDRP